MECSKYGYLTKGFLNGTDTEADTLFLEGVFPFKRHVGLTRISEGRGKKNMLEGALLGEPSEKAHKNRSQIE